MQMLFAYPKVTLTVLLTVALVVSFVAMLSPFVDGVDIVSANVNGVPLRFGVWAACINDPTTGVGACFDYVLIRRAQTGDIDATIAGAVPGDIFILDALAFLPLATITTLVSIIYAVVQTQGGTDNASTRVGVCAATTLMFMALVVELLLVGKVNAGGAHAAVFMTAISLVFLIGSTATLFVAPRFAKPRGRITI
ncbi:hypothetical protein EXIGLDRAFT_52687 [Exidia glandulosa HHB12029]|uniref:Pali-domain-containing protein n=1 Tax=Exidia glandulosa HHB12029 TaxID=1314781 RepID=A0A165ICY9_EXIGL|nr:hypothetical protein EXIGLDRAFT_52687 [Exidia glandulosa HHB12029]